MKGCAQGSARSWLELLSTGDLRHGQLLVYDQGVLFDLEGVEAWLRISGYAYACEIRATQKAFSSVVIAVLQLSGQVVRSPLMRADAQLFEIYLGQSDPTSQVIVSLGDLLVSSSNLRTSRIGKRRTERNDPRKEMILERGQFGKIKEEGCSNGKRFWNSMALMHPSLGIIKNRYILVAPPASRFPEPFVCSFSFVTKSVRAEAILNNDDFRETNSAMAKVRTRRPCRRVRRLSPSRSHNAKINDRWRWHIARIVLNKTAIRAQDLGVPGLSSIGKSDVREAFRFMPSIELLSITPQHEKYWSCFKLWGMRGETPDFSATVFRLAKAHFRKEVARLLWDTGATIWKITVALNQGDADDAKFLIGTLFGDQFSQKFAGTSQCSRPEKPSREWRVYTAEKYLGHYCHVDMHGMRKVTLPQSLFPSNNAPRYELPHRFGPATGNRFEVRNHGGICAVDNYFACRASIELALRERTRRRHAANVGGGQPLSPFGEQDASIVVRWCYTSREEESYPLPTVLDGDKVPPWKTPTIKHKRINLVAEISYWSGRDVQRTGTSAKLASEVSRAETHLLGKQALRNGGPVAFRVYRHHLTGLTRIIEAGELLHRSRVKSWRASITEAFDTIFPINSSILSFGHAHDSWYWKEKASPLDACGYHSLLICDNPNVNYSSLELGIPFTRARDTASADGSSRAYYRQTHMLQRGTSYRIESQFLRSDSLPYGVGQQAGKQLQYFVVASGGLNEEGRKFIKWQPIFGHTGRNIDIVMPGRLRQRDQYRQNFFASAFLPRFVHFLGSLPNTRLELLLLGLNSGSHLSPLPLVDAILDIRAGLLELLSHSILVIQECDTYILVSSYRGKFNIEFVFSLPYINPTYERCSGHIDSPKVVSCDWYLHPADLPERAPITNYLIPRNPGELMCSVRLLFRLSALWRPMVKKGGYLTGCRSTEQCSCLPNAQGLDVVNCTDEDYYNPKYIEEGSSVLGLESFERAWNLGAEGRSPEGCSKALFVPRSECWIRRGTLDLEYVRNFSFAARNYSTDNRGEAGLGFVGFTRQISVWSDPVSEYVLTSFDEAEDASASLSCSSGHVSESMDCSGRLLQELSEASPSANDIASGEETTSYQGIKLVGQGSKFCQVTPELFFPYDEWEYKTYKAAVALNASDAELVQDHVTLIFHESEPKIDRPSTPLERSKYQTYQESLVITQVEREYTVFDFGR
ncbi:uncharacterized protein BDR25DRAFT_352468 [Lindgomyces ingoldianus]|uniref:Uncharacterized protein n=1 Tax=Lindgomyces ingoldianus TaxID=673940 RepID=A0ACB6R6R1_9PLEO|nr:uncharacterized protein BDR25DRAFT_352468 [Lindgomyces ingoldianus]KAF2474005.1 hypothetical protein BDR25DRAFT_352468 [Lindgomyces ingoldianus]